MDSTIYVVKRKALISCEVTAQLLFCVHLFLHMQKSWFSNDGAHFVLRFNVPVNSI